MGLFGPKSKEYGDLNRKSITEIDKTVEKQEEELSEPFAGDKPGMVPASDTDTQAKFLRGDGEWATPAGGGGGGTTDYNELANKPAIDNVGLTKNTTAKDLGLVKEDDLADYAKKTDIPDTSDFVTDEDLADYAKKTDIPSVPSKTSQLTNDSGFITGNDIPSIPSKTSDLQNDSGYLTSETDPTVPSWAKQQNPPTPATFDGEHAGLVPAPASGDSGKYLKADGTWATPESGASWVEVTGTLTAGQTSITLSNAAITSTSTIDVYTDGDVDYNSVTPGNGSVTITFEAQQTDLGVKVRVS